MSEFDKLNLMVVPIQDPVKFHKLPNYQGFPLKWSDPKTYCSWEERETIYPGVKDWYVIPPARSTFFRDGLEIGYWVMDIDNHEGDKYHEAIEFLRTCHIPPSLTIRTPSGGLHIYYWALKEDLPAPISRSKDFDLPIEIKTSVGVVAPNGRDRVVIKDLPVAYFSITEDNPLSKIAKLKKNTSYTQKKPTDPDFPIEEEPFPEVGPGDRHNTLMATACSLYARGCPPEKIQEWGEEFYSRTGRKEQPKEISNIVRDAMKYIDEGEAEAEQELEELKAEAEQPNDQPDPLAGFTPLEGWESVHAKSIFSTKDEIKSYIKQELPSIPPEDIPFARGMLTSPRATWKKTPYAKQVEYEPFKDTVKLLMEATQKQAL